MNLVKILIYVGMIFCYFFFRKSLKMRSGSNLPFRGNNLFSCSPHFLWKMKADTPIDQRKFKGHKNVTDF